MWSQNHAAAEILQCYAVRVDRCNALSPYWIRQARHAHSSKERRQTKEKIKGGARGLASSCCSIPTFLQLQFQTSDQAFRAGGGLTGHQQSRAIAACMYTGKQLFPSNKRDIDCDVFSMKPTALAPLPFPSPPPPPL